VGFASGILEVNMKEHDEETTDDGIGGILLLGVILLLLWGMLSQPESKP
jgi:hypothetical protein